MAKAIAPKKSMTKSEILNAISNETELPRKQVSAVLEALNGQISKSLGRRGPGVFTLPGLIKIEKKKIPARKARKNVPNPFRPGSGAGFDAARMEIRNVPKGAAIRIYSMGGELVIELLDADGDGVESWDGKNRDGRNVASGIYYLVATSSPDGGERVRQRGKIVIIR